MSEPPADDAELGTEEENLGGPQYGPEAATLSAAEEYLKPQGRGRGVSNVTVHGEIHIPAADADGDDT